MSIRTRKFREIYEVDLFLNGGLYGGLDIIRGNPTGGGASGVYGVYGLVGETLKFKQPAGVTVTFVPGADSAGRLAFSEIKAQIESGIAAVKVELFQSHITLVEVSPLAGVTLDHTGTANALLGFDTAVDTAGVVYGGMGGGAPSLQGAYSTNDNMHVILTLDAGGEKSDISTPSDISPSDTTDITTKASIGITIGTAGNLVFRMAGDPSNSHTLVVQAGQFVYGQFTRVMAATTAGGIIGWAP